MSLRLSLCCVPLTALAAAPAPAQDITVSEIGIYFAADDYMHWGNAQSKAAYSWAATACNQGAVPLDWFGNESNAPILGSNAFRIVGGRIEHIGYSFIKYGFCAVDVEDRACAASCQETQGSCSLGVGCSDVYWASLNDGRFGYGKWEVDPISAVWPATTTGPTGPPTIRGRVQIEHDDIDDPGAVFVVESQYLSAHDHGAGNAGNNFGWRQVDIDGVTYAMSSAGPTVLGDPAIYAWQAFANDVQVVEAPVIDEGGPGQHGWVFVASRAIDEGGGQWRYEYAVQNTNSDRGVGTVTIDVPCDVGFAISEDHFRGVLHHSGSPYSSDDWAFQNPSGRVAWRATPFASDPDASALRWGELASFGFTCNRPPVSGSAVLGLFKPGTPASVTAEVVVPAGDFPTYCDVNRNSTGSPALVSATGSPHVAHESMTLEVTSLPTDKAGYFLMSQTQGFLPNFGGSQGNLCLGSRVLRFGKWVQDSRGTGTVSFDLDFSDLPQGTVFQPGDVWHLQYWYRDNNPGQTSNTSDAVTITFCP